MLKDKYFESILKYILLTFGKKNILNNSKTPKRTFEMQKHEQIMKSDFPRIYIPVEMLISCTLTKRFANSGA